MLNSERELWIGREAGLVKQIMGWLKKEKIFHFKVHGSQYQKVGLPDIAMVRNGRAAYIEVKNKKGVVSKIQTRVMGELKDAGAVVGVARNLFQAQDILSNSGFLRGGLYDLGFDRFHMKSVNRLATELFQALSLDDYKRLILRLQEKI